jgi:hypothetical protein
MPTPAEAKIAGIPLVRERLMQHIRTHELRLGHAGDKAWLDNVISELWDYVFALDPTQMVENAALAAEMSVEHLLRLTADIHKDRWQQNLTLHDPQPAVVVPPEGVPVTWNLAEAETVQAGVWTLSNDDLTVTRVHSTGNTIRRILTGASMPEGYECYFEGTFANPTSISEHNIGIAMSDEGVDPGGNWVQGWSHPHSMGAGGNGAISINGEGNGFNWASDGGVDTPTLGFYIKYDFLTGPEIYVIAQKTAGPEVYNINLPYVSDATLHILASSALVWNPEDLVSMTINTTGNGATPYVHDYAAILAAELITIGTTTPFGEAAGV